MIAALVLGLLGAMGGWLVGCAILWLFFGLDLAHPAGGGAVEMAVFFGIVGLGAVSGELIGAVLVYRRQWPNRDRAALELDYDDREVSER